MSSKQTLRLSPGGSDMDRREFIKRLSLGISGAALAGAGGLSPVDALADDIELNPSVTRSSPRMLESSPSSMARR